MVSFELDTLTKAWPDIRVEVSLSAEPGHSLAIAGPSGCGKSTVLRMAAGLLRPDSGRVLVAGRDVTRDEPSDRGIGMVFQDYALFPHLDVGGNVAYGLRCSSGSRRLGRTSIEARVSQLLASVDLAGFEHRRPHELSGGERQRVALARTLAVAPRVVLFDEPLSSLDAALRKRLRADLVDEQRRLGFTAVYVTHDLEEAMSIGDTLAIMDGGRVLQCEPPSLLWNHPASVAVARFVGSGPTLRMQGSPRRTGSNTCVATAAGSFVLDAAALADYERITATGEQPFLYFERSAARPLRAPSEQPSASCFDASCVRTEFAGDTVDCVMNSGGEIFTIRLPREQAPHAGEQLRYYVATDRVGIIPDIRTH
ncbi:MAG TPA: ABC transporter ATP-binding protein [bacterium]|nr:ABC transporter ATP-binding protein [bacterium]